jgi:membrane protein YdbS with pleckstrin-like domain
MLQAIAGISPSTLRETTIITVWPSVARFGIGRLLGGWYDIKAGGYIFTVGNLLALVFIPVSLVLYFAKVLPWIATRYRLTNRRVIVEKGWELAEDKFVELDRFDTIDVVVQPGQRWYKAGDLIFRKANVETFRLEGVSRPEAFKQICWKAHRAHVTVRAALEREKHAVVA